MSEKDLCTINLNLQKQPPRGVPRKKCSENMQEIHRRTPMSRCDFNKFALHSDAKLNTHRKPRVR